MKKIKVIDLFAGVGGLSYGFAHDPHFEIVAANEILPAMATAYGLNHPCVKVYNEDIRGLTADRLRGDLGIRAGDVELLVGGPPCQAYSTVGKRLIDDPRGKLFQEYYRLLRELEPKFFLFENVRGLLSMGGGELLPTIVALFESLGYRVQYRLLNAADYGAPQIRERVILVGSRLKTDFAYPPRTHRAATEPIAPKLRPHLTLGEAIGDLPFIAAGESATAYATAPQNDFQKLMRRNAPAELRDHNAPRNNARLVRLMELLPEGGSAHDLPAEFKPTSGYKNTYCRLWWDRPATTVTRNLGTPSSSRCIHPRAARALTTREGARLQGFPDDYQFFGSRGEKNLQVGNAVPPLLSVPLAKAILAAFRTED